MWFRIHKEVATDLLSVWESVCKGWRRRLPAEIMVKLGSQRILRQGVIDRVNFVDAVQAMNSNAS